jgi:hypothetical protein
VFVGKQDIRYHCEIITCIVITLINIKSSRNINCYVWSPESSSTTSNILTSLSLKTLIDPDIAVSMIILLFVCDRMLTYWMSIGPGFVSFVYMYEL